MMRLSPLAVRSRLGATLLGALVFSCLLTGCIRSRVEITSDPPGAEVIWRGKPYGATPITIPFIWYWYYDFSLDKPGYKHLDVVERFTTPPWFLMPMDLMMEIVPVPIHDTRHRNYVLEVAEKNELGPAQPATIITPQTLGIIKSGLQKK